MPALSGHLHLEKAKKNGLSKSVFLFVCHSRESGNLLYKKLFLLVLRSQRFDGFSDVFAIFKVLWRKLVPVLVIDFLPEFF